MRDRQKLLLLLGLVLVTLAAHWRVLQNEFVNYDDNDYVTANPIVQKGLTVEGIRWAFGNLSGAKTYWHPLTWLSHMADCQFFKLNPAGHHAMSLLFHTVNVLLLFLVLERMTGARWRSVVVAALWAVHPLQVDTVAWVSERKNLLSALFWLLSMAAYVRYAAKPGLGRYLLVVLGMALGLMCKPVLVTLPCALLLLDFWPLRRWRAKAAELADGPDSRRFPPLPFRRLFLEKLPLLALSIASGLLTLHVHNALGMRQELYGLTTSLKIQNAIVSYIGYIDNTLWPSKLTVLYLHPGAWPGWKVAFCAVVFGILSLLALWHVRTRPYVLVGWLWFLGVLMPTNGLRQAGMQAMADRFAYLPLIGLLVMIVWTAADWFARHPTKPLLPAAVAAAVLAGLSVVTLRQTAYWRDSIALWERALAVDDRNFIAHSDLSVAYTEANQLARARRHAIEAIRLLPEFVEPRIQLGLICLMEKTPDAAAGYFEEALRARPGAPEVFLRSAYYIGANVNLPTGIAMLASYLKVFPADLPQRAQLALMLSAAGRSAEAAQRYRELLAIQPDQPVMLNNLAWLLATSADAAARNGAEAVTHAERACQLTGRRQAILIGTLAAAYAEAGRFEDATRAASEAIAVASSAGENNIAGRNRQLLELYRAGKPFHEPAGN